jgi:hypothetical protein
VCTPRRCFVYSVMTERLTRVTTCHSSPRLVELGIDRSGVRTSSIYAAPVAAPARAGRPGAPRRASKSRRGTSTVTTSP